MDLSIITALFEQVLNSPASLLVIVGVNIIAYLLEIWPKFDSRYIPIICILASAFAYPFFSSRASVPPEYPNPLAVLIVNGLIVGFAATVLHSKFIKKFLTDLPQPQPPK